MNITLLYYLHSPYSMIIDVLRLYTMFCCTKLGHFPPSSDHMGMSEMTGPKSSSVPVTVVEEIRYIIKRQEIELEDLRKRMDHVVSFAPVIVI